MTIQLELSPALEAKLALAAEARGIAPEKYAGDLPGCSGASGPGNG